MSGVPVENGRLYWKVPVNLKGLYEAVSVKLLQLCRVDKNKPFDVLELKYDSSIR